MFIGLHHVCISTADLDRTIEFYCSMLGGERIGVERNWEKGSQGSDIRDEMLQIKDSAYRVAFVKVGKAFIEFFEFSSPQPEELKRRTCDYGLAHLCFVVDDVWAENHRLKKIGMVFHREPYTHVSGGIYTYGKDPDGNVIELLEIPEGARVPNNYAS